MTSVVEGRAIVRDYHVPGNMLRRAKSVRAVKGIDFSVQKGKTLAIVGESGSGKSTLARIIALIDAPSQGELLIEGQRVDINASRPGPELRSKVQMVFQNPYGSLNPRQKIGDVLTEPLVINTDVPAAERRDRARAMLKKVGLMPEHYNRYPHMFSGGQRQRIAIARALMLNPSLLVLDEPTAHVDRPTAAELIQDVLAAAPDRTVLLITHREDEARLTQRVLRLRRGRIIPG